MFVCLGNICRSPTAHGVFETLANRAGVDVYVESAGTGAWHLGDPPDARAQQEAAARGYDLSGNRGQQVTGADFARFDLIIAMDHSNLIALERLRPIESETPVQLFLDFTQSSHTEVPDPYYEGGFELVFELIEEASRGLLDQLQKASAVAPNSL